MPSNARILVVEDDRDHARALSLRLRSEGYEVTVALDAYQATHAARKAAPDLVIMDYRLPAGDGLRVHERLNDLIRGGVPVIYITGHSSQEVELHARALGAVGVFQKPVDSRKLLSAMRNCLELSELKAIAN